MMMMMLGTKYQTQWNTTALHSVCAAMQRTMISLYLTHFTPIQKWHYLVITHGTYPPKNQRAASNITVLAY